MGKVAAKQTVRRKLGIGSCNCRFELGFAVKFRSLFIVLFACNRRTGGLGCTVWPQAGVSCIARFWEGVIPQPMRDAESHLLRLHVVLYQKGHIGDHCREKEQGQLVGDLEKAKRTHLQLLVMKAAQEKFQLKGGKINK